MCRSTALDKVSGPLPSGADAAGPAAGGGSASSDVNHLGTNDFIRAQRSEPAHQIFQFAHVARPAILLQSVNRPLVEALGRQTVFTSAFQEMPRQQSDVLDALAQRRQADRNHIQAIE